MRPKLSMAETAARNKNIAVLLRNWENTHEEIADLHDCSIAVVQRVAKENGIKFRDRKIYKQFPSDESPRIDCKKLMTICYHYDQCYRYRHCTAGMAGKLK